MKNATVRSDSYDILLKNSFKLLYSNNELCRKKFCSKNTVDHFIRSHYVLIYIDWFIVINDFVNF